MKTKVEIKGRFLFTLLFVMVTLCMIPYAQADTSTVQSDISNLYLQYGSTTNGFFQSPYFNLDYIVTSGSVAYHFSDNSDSLEVSGPVTTSEGGSFPNFYHYRTTNNWDPYETTTVQTGLTASSGNSQYFSYSTNNTSTITSIDHWYEYSYHCGLFSTCHGAYPVYRYDTYYDTNNYAGYNGAFEIDQQLDQSALNQILSGQLPFSLRQMYGDLYFTGAELTFNYEPVETRSIPEPTTMLLLGFGLIGIAGLRKRFRG